MKDGKTYALFADAIGETYNLEDYITQRLVLTYVTYSRTLKTKYVKHIDAINDGAKDGEINNVDGKDLLDPPAIRMQPTTHSMLITNIKGKLPFPKCTPNPPKQPCFFVN